MKKFLSEICIVILVLCGLNLCACKSADCIDSNVYSMSVSNVRMLKPDTLTIYQIDSIVKADKLPSFKKWRQSSFKDDETLKVLQYRILVDPNTNTTYNIKQLSNGKYVLFKRQLDLKK